MENDGKRDKTNDHIKEILYIEMIHQQMQTYISLDKLLTSRNKKAIVSKTQTP